MMLDPLSLSDVKGLKPNSENEVEVSVVFPPPCQPVLPHALQKLIQKHCLPIQDLFI